MALADGDAAFDGVEMGATTSHGITWDRLAGLTDQPRTDDPPPRLRDTAVPAWAQMGWRQVTATGIQVEGDANLRALRAAMANREDVRELTFRDDALSDEVLMVAVQADRMEFDRGASEHVNREYRPAVQWSGLDPTIFTAEETVEEFGDTPAPYFDLTVTNDGTMASPSGRAWTLELEAHGTIKGPYIRITSHAEIVSWPSLQMTNGQKLFVEVDRSSRIGTLGLDGLVRSAGSDFPNWPILREGTQAVRVGATTGNISGVFRYRSTW